MTDALTVLRCARGLHLAKVITSTEIVPYSQCRTFDAWTRSISGLTDLHDLLTDLVVAPRCCVVRGELIAGAEARQIRRLIYPDPETGDVPTLRDAPREWLALDMEGVERPADVPAADLRLCAEMATARLPIAFRIASHIVQATAGHGIKAGVRCRLWYWLSRPTTGTELRRWLKGTPADPSIFSSGQPIFTAAPVFTDGIVDHLPERLLSIAGLPMVEVPSQETLAPPLSPPPRPLPEPGSDRAQRYAIGALRAAAIAVATAPTDSRHVTCRSQSRGLARLVDAGLLAGSDVIRVMDEALVQAGKSPGEGAKVATWALAHPSTAQLPEGLR